MTLGRSDLCLGVGKNIKIGGGRVEKIKKLIMVAKMFYNNLK